MNSKCMQLLMSIIFFSSAQIVIADPVNIIVKNASAFDFVYKLLHAEHNLYQHGKSTPHGYEENLITAGDFKLVRVGPRRPMRFAIKRHGYGSGATSGWFDVPGPEELAAEQLNAEQLKAYNEAIGKGKLPTITIKSSFLGGWSFSIGYTN